MSASRIEMAAKAPRRKANQKAGPAGGEGERARVLVVDDDEHNLLAIRTVLEDLAEVEVAASGDAALRHLLKGEFAVILLDVFMPGLDGYETAKIIRAREQTRRIPIIFLSAVNKEKEHLIRGYAMGAVDYVFKPVEPVVLRSKVAVFVDLFRMAREIQVKAEQEQKLLDENLAANAERLRIEQELRLAEQRQAAIIRSLPIVLYLEAADAAPRRPQFVGGDLAALTGFAFEALDRTPDLWTERLHPEDRERALRAVRERGDAGAMAIEYRWRCADERYKYFLDQAVLLKGERGAPDQYAGTLLDVTERKELENQLLQAHKMDAIGKLTGGIAHDFNNLLAAILGGLGLVERRATLSEDQLKVLTMTRRAAEQGSELVGRLLAFSRRQQLRPDTVDLAGLAASLTDILAHTLGGLVNVEWDLAAEAWPAFVDATQLELALMNLIINARDAMPRGGTVKVAAANRRAKAGNRHDLPAGDYVVLAVEDNGSGIPPDLLQQVTEPFFTTKEVGKGTGLGLSMVYGFARQSGGAIDIQSEMGKGTRVEIWLPRAGTHVRKPIRHAVAQPSDMNGAALKILLVDDHDVVRETTAGMLRDLGHSVVEESCGAQLLATFEKKADAFDLIVSDYAMPGLSGHEVLHRARLIRPDLPAILISGYADREAIAGGQDQMIILTKPFTIDQMRAAISEAHRS